MRSQNESIRLGLATLVATAVAAGCGSTASDSRARRDESERCESTSAGALVSRAKERFVLPVQRDLRQDEPAKPVQVLKPASMKLVRDGGYIAVRTPHLPRPPVRRARVRLPSRSDGAFELVDGDSNVRVDVALKASGSSPASIVDGYVVYVDGLDKGVHLIHRPRMDGTEDYVIFDREPSASEVRYLAALGAGVAGLRAVSDVLEFLDHDGTPRLRVAPAFVVDAHGDHHAAELHVEGCNVSVDPAPPWGRLPTPPGADVCEIVFSWGSVRYPSMLDPAWTTTGDMIQPRHNHTATRLQSGRVLVVGGEAMGFGVLDSAELYDPTTGTWSATGSVTPPRRWHAASALPSGRVLIAGGNDGATVLVDVASQVFDESLGTWSITDKLTKDRAGHTATMLPNGEVLVAGGGTSGGAVADAEQYDPSTSQWSPVASMSSPRIGHTANLLHSGLVLVAGGSSANALATTELYDPASNTWSQGGTMTQSRDGHTATVLASGKVLVAGGSSTGVPPTAEVFDPVTNIWTSVGSMLERRILHVAAALPTGRVLVAGGLDSTGAFASAEVFDEDTSTWWNIGSMAEARRSATATVLLNGAVLIAGGVDSAWYAAPAAEVFAIQVDGQSCQHAAECMNGNCVVGTCCNTPCDQAWEGCREYQTGLFSADLTVIHPAPGS